MGWERNVLWWELARYETVPEFVPSDGFFWLYGIAFPLCPALYIFALGVYLTVSIPSLRTIVDPIVGVDTRSDRIEAMRVLGAGNTIIMVLLGAVLCLQVNVWFRSPPLQHPPFFRYCGPATEKRRLRVSWVQVGMYLIHSTGIDKPRKIHFFFSFLFFLRK